MAYDDTPVFHLDHEWLSQIDPAIRNKKKIKKLQTQLDGTKKDLDETKQKHETELKTMNKKITANKELIDKLVRSEKEMSEKK